MDMISGLLVSVGLWILGWMLGAPAIVGLIASLPFGSTAILSLGGLTVPVSFAMAGVLLAVTAAHRNFLRDLAAVLRSQPLAKLICVMVGYAVATAFIFPRLFAHKTIAFVPIDSEIVDMPLGPVPGNINRSMYLILDCLVFVAICIQLRRGRTAEVRRGFLAFAAINAALGLIDIFGKLAGQGDLLAPIRTASYNMLSNQTAGSFFRIMGGFPEPSAYAAAGALPALGFTLMDWRCTQSWFSLALALVLVMLLIFSTSSTAYAGLGIVLGVYGLSVGLSVLRGRLFVRHIILFALVWITLTILLAVYLYDEHLMNPAVTMILNSTVYKVYTASAVERGIWNAQSVQNFFDTFGVGVGLGSTRSSSWPVSVLAQLGVIGGVGFAIAVAVLAAGLLRFQEPGIGALAASASAAALAWVAGSSLSGSGADPNMIFFLALATVSASLAESKQARSVSSGISRPRLASPSLANP